MNKGVLTTISGFSGAGKGTIVKRLLEKYPDFYALSISATTRGPRVGEEDGREYFFKTREEFEHLIETGQMLEYAQYVGNYYGTPRAYVEEQLAKGKDILLEIEIQGSMQVKKLMPETLMLFVTPPSFEDLRNRLVGRGTEDEATIQARLLRASEESEGIDQYDYLVINDELEACVDEVHRLIQMQKNRTIMCEPFIEQFKKDLEQYAKGVC